MALKYKEQYKEQQLTADEHRNAGEHSGAYKRALSMMHSYGASLLHRPLVLSLRSLHIAQDNSVKTFDLLNYMQKPPSSTISLHCVLTLPIRVECQHKDCAMACR
eukprot:6399-Heterococcus_DN1.PRE.3